MSVWYKQGVCGSLTYNAAQGLLCMEKVFIGVEDIYITSVREATHGAGSLHPCGDAFDMRKPKAISIHEIRNVLGKNFDVVEESDHIHVEFDEKDKQA